MTTLSVLALPAVVNFDVSPDSIAFPFVRVRAYHKTPKSKPNRLKLKLKLEINMEIKADK